MQRQPVTDTASVTDTCGFNNSRLLMRQDEMGYTIDHPSIFVQKAGFLKCIVGQTSTRYLVMMVGNQIYGIFTARRHVSAVYAIILCLSVCL